GLPVAIASRAHIAMSDPALASEIAFRAISHLKAMSLATGAGASALGGERIRRLAKDPSAPQDQNGNGTNLDEVWSQEVAQLSSAAGSPTTTINYPLLFPWSHSSADLAASVQGKTSQDLDAWRTVASGDTTLDLAQVADAMLARTLAAIRLLSDNRGSLLGPDP